MRKFAILILLFPLLAACASTHPPSCDGSSKRPVNEPAAAVGAPSKTVDGPGPVLVERWRER